jgi:hypothetical protein
VLATGFPRVQASPTAIDYDGDPQGAVSNNRNICQLLPQGSFRPGSLRRSRMNSDKRSLRDRSCRKACRSARAFPPVSAGQPENASPSSSPTSAPPPPHFRHPPSGIARLNGISDSWRATVLLPLHARHQQTSLRNAISVPLRASPWNLDRHLPGSLLLLPVLGICDRTRAP